QLMDSRSLSPADKKALREEIEQIVRHTEDLLSESTRVLGSLTSLLGVVLSPKLSTGVLERLEVVKLSSTRAMFIISVKSGLVKTMVFRVDLDVKRSTLDEVVALLNERLVGLTLQEIRDSIHERVADLTDMTGIVQLTLKESGQLFNEVSEGGRLLFGNTQGLLSQPEFREPEDLRTLIELIEDKDTVVSVIEDKHIEELTGIGQATVSIGSENGVDRNFERYSIVTAQYKLGESIGTIGVIGPKRMEYGRIVSLVEGMAKVLTSSAVD
ncbi:MAG: heat-inducible transcription repressor HrcA, partial [Bacteroidetes bacterium]|nr:heat-inducible transcription repressor HrcA [Bacteroidota bacterium]